MSEYSKIEWTESTWNPVTGCKKISPACDNCYAEHFANRFKGVKDHPYEQGFEIKLWPGRLKLPLKWKTPRTIFVNSMSDLFLNEVPDNFIDQVFEIMSKTKQHIYQILTKRVHRMVNWFEQNYKYDNYKIPSNIWMGVSVENNDYIFRIEYLKQITSKIRFISFEPLIGPININEDLLKDISWIIVGGESGPSARPMREEWVDNIFSTCMKLDIPFFFKQWGTYNVRGEKVGKKHSGRIYKGTIWNQIPKTQYI